MQSSINVPEPNQMPFTKFLGVLCVRAHTGFVAIRRHATVGNAPCHTGAPTRSRRSLETPLGGFTSFSRKRSPKTARPMGFWKVEPPPAGFFLPCSKAQATSARPAIFPAFGARLGQAFGYASHRTLYLCAEFEEGRAGRLGPIGACPLALASSRRARAGADHGAGGLTVAAKANRASNARFERCLGTRSLDLCNTNGVWMCEADPAASRAPTPIGPHTDGWESSKGDGRRPGRSAQCAASSRVCRLHSPLTI
jgi:hypothetical protein